VFIPFAKKSPFKGVAKDFSPSSYVFISPALFLWDRIGSLRKGGTPHFCLCSGCVRRVLFLFLKPVVVGWNFCGSCGLCVPVFFWVYFPSLLCLSKSFYVRCVLCAGVYFMGFYPSLFYVVCVVFVEGICCGVSLPYFLIFTCFFYGVVNGVPLTDLA